MSRQSREPSDFLALYKTFASLEEDRKPFAPEPFYTASNFLALRLAMAALTYEMMLVTFATFVTFLIVFALFRHNYALLRRDGDMRRSGAAETWGGQGHDFTL